MARSDYLFTSESVSEGHPDKVCDRISDEVVDLFFREGPKEGMSPWDIRAACETLCTTNRVVIAGETRGPKKVQAGDVEEAARKAIKDIGYEQDGFHWRNANVEVLLHAQSAHIAQGVDASGNKDEGAGDQGIMFGYACRETPALMPAPLFYSHKILELLAQVRKAGKEPTLLPDAKSQVSVEYDGSKPIRIDTVVISTQHAPEATPTQIREEVIEHIIKPVMPKELLDAKTKYHINPTGRFVVGGPQGDCGLTGRKIIVDSYGGMGRHGGGAFSGKDPTKVDRSACYMARYVAKNVVAAGLADRVEIQLAYAIGVADPVSVAVDTFDTGKIPDEKISQIIRDHFQLTPRGIIESLNLRRPIYRKTTNYGHFGRSEPEFSWEMTDKAASMKKQAGL